LRIDDPIGAVPVHMVAGIWGTPHSTLRNGAYGVPTPMGADTSTVVKGLFYGGGMTQLISQLIGGGVTTVATLVVAFVLMYAVKATGTLRVSREGELEVSTFTSTACSRIGSSRRTRQNRCMACPRRLPRRHRPRPGCKETMMQLIKQVTFGPTRSTT
jgi:ammonia channel protein AmtB